MRRGLSTLRLPLNAGVLLFGGLISHFIGGGTFIDSSLLIQFSALIFLALILTLRVHLEGPKLAILILVIQSASHVLLGGMTESNMKMAISHLTGAMISFAAMAKVESALQFLLDYGKQLFWPVNIVRVLVPPQKRIGLLPIVKLHFAFDFFWNIARRGPPFRIWTVA